ncbi:MAG: hypothetical protein RLZZ562_40 [Planctomycetota bacterium]|jgi:uncharacterized coiled-coil protein SlyX
MMARTSLSMLMDQRAECRRALAELSRALAEVQSELRDWQPERTARGKDAPQSLRALWTDLEELERSLVQRWLAMDVTRRSLDRAIVAHLRERPMAS